MFFFILFFFLSVFASHNPQTVIVHMPGHGDGGLGFLNPGSNYLNYQNRFSEELNPQKTFYQYKSLDNTCIYTNNIPKNRMDLGGPCCVQFYKEMILEAHQKYPDADIILAGASQGSVGPFGALAQLAQENHLVILKIKKVLIEAVLGSTHETINFHARKIPILKILPCISEKITPLIAEYLPRFIPGFAYYDAFAPQMYHYAREITRGDLNEPMINRPSLRHINYYIIHDLYDRIIPYQCASNTHSLLPQNQVNLVQTTDSGHLPADFHQSEIIDFLKSKEAIAQDNIQTIKPPIDTWFISKIPLHRFIIRRVRDVISIASAYIFFKSLTFVCKKFIWYLKNIAR